MSDYVDVMAILIGSRFVESKHLGLGDIRLTPDEQDSIVDYVQRLERSCQEWNEVNHRLQARIDELEVHLQDAYDAMDISTEVANQIKAEGIKGMFEHYGTRHPTEREIDEWLDKLEKGE